MRPVVARLSLVRLRLPVVVEGGEGPTVAGVRDREDVRQVGVGVRRVPKVEALAANVLVVDEVPIQRRPLRKTSNGVWGESGSGRVWRLLVSFPRDDSRLSVL